MCYEKDNLFVDKGLSQYSENMILFDSLVPDRYCAIFTM